jgi:hypothetical protein
MTMFQGMGFLQRSYKSKPEALRRAQGLNNRLAQGQPLPTRQEDLEKARAELEQYGAEIGLDNLGANIAHLKAAPRLPGHFAQLATYNEMACALFRQELAWLQTCPPGDPDTDRLIVALEKLIPPYEKCATLYRELAADYGRFTVVK